MRWRRWWRPRKAASPPSTASCTSGLGLPLSRRRRWRRRVWPRRPRACRRRGSPLNVGGWSAQPLVLPSSQRKEKPMYTTSFWLGAADRAAKSFAQALLLLWGADAGFNVLSVAPGPAIGVAIGGAVLSLLTSIVSAPVGDQ